MLVNGRRPPPEGILVDPDRDEVSVAGRTVRPAATFRHLILNKPAGVLVTASDPKGRPTVFDLVAEQAAGHRLFAVGRLDYDTSGLLLLTDEGRLANRLAHPRHKVPKEYLATVRGVPSAHDLRRLREGVALDDGPTLPADAELVDSRRDGVSLIRLVITEGRNRQVRRMLEAVEHPVIALTRTAFGPVRLGRLREGDVRRVREDELAALRAAAGL